jgi:hypothetical protein
MRASRIFGLAACLSSLALASACQDDTTTDAGPEAQGMAPDADASRNDATTSEIESPGDGGGTPDRDDAGVSPAPYVHFDVNHVLSTGQSNAVANDGKPVLSKVQPYENLMFDTGVMTGGSCDGDGCTVYQQPTSFVPLVEGDWFFGPYTEGQAVETMSSGLANEAALLGLGKNHVLLVSLHGRSGNSYACLRKGGCGWWPNRGYVEPFDEAMRQVKDAKTIADAAGKTYAVRAITTIHGEHDHYAYAANESAFPLAGTDGASTLADYADALLEWQRDYESGVKTLTGQTVSPPLFLNQYSHWNNVPTTKIAYMQLDAHVRSHGDVPSLRRRR